MDQLITWSLAAIAAGAFTAAFVFDYLAEGTDLTRMTRLLVGALGMLAWGTFVVSTIVIIDSESGTQRLFAAFNRAILAGVGITLAYRTGTRYWRTRHQDRSG